MRAIVPYLPALACGVMMLLMCVPMMRRHHKESSDSPTHKEVAALRDEVERLKALNASRSPSETISG